jgi:catechol 2,3-dioxygenase-like lactoylglutathione lyase family enzyme
MLTTTGAFSGMSVDDLDAARGFYRDVLGFEVENGPNGITVRRGGVTSFLYPKVDHQPASYTAVYVEVPDVDAAVDELAAAGIELEHYEGLHQDEKGVSRGRAAGMGPDIAWFRDPAGNILAILTE